MTFANLPNRYCVTFLTDLGIRDTYVGQMKGVALSINPELQLVDLSHEISRQEVLRGAFAWDAAVSAFPRDTIHVGSIGSARRLVAAEVGDRRFVCPDNGLLTVILRRARLRRAVCLDEPRWWHSPDPNTFQARDVLAPVAAAWSLGHDLAEFGSPLTSPLITLPLAEIIRGRNSISGVVVDVNRFGNLITNIDCCDLPAKWDLLQIEVGGFHVFGLNTCNGETPAGEVVALPGSSGQLEIVVGDGSAADELQAECGRRVVVRWSETNE